MPTNDATARKIGVTASMVASLTVAAGIVMALPASAAPSDSNPPAPPKPGNNAWTGPAQAPIKETGPTVEYGKTPLPWLHPDSAGTANPSDHNPPAPPKPDHAASWGPAQAPIKVTGPTVEYGKTPLPWHQD